MQSVASARGYLVSILGQGQSMALVDGLLAQQPQPPAASTQVGYL